MITLTDSTFEETIANSTKPVLVDFYATWCGPCRILGPILEQLAGELDDIEFVKFNADSGQTPDDYDVTSLPTLVLLDKGQEVARLEGLLPKPKLVEWIKNNTPN